MNLSDKCPQWNGSCMVNRGKVDATCLPLWASSEPPLRWGRPFYMGRSERISTRKCSVISSRMKESHLSSLQTLGEWLENGMLVLSLVKGRNAVGSDLLFQFVNQNCSHPKAAQSSTSLGIIFVIV